MAKFKVIGECVVGGVKPGGVVELDLPDENIEALIRCGNIEPVKAKVIEPKGGE